MIACLMCDGRGYVDGIVDGLVPCGCFEGAALRLALTRISGADPFPIIGSRSIRVRADLLDDARRSLAFHRLGHAFAALGYAIKAGTLPRCTVMRADERAASMRDSINAFNRSHPIARDLTTPRAPR